MNAKGIVTAILAVALLLCSCEQNSPPVIPDQQFEVYESGWFIQYDPIVEAFDPEGDPLRFGIAGGNEEGIFGLHPGIGRLSLVRPELLDYEKTQRYMLKVVVSDNHEKYPLESSAIIPIKVLNSNELSDQLIAWLPFNGDAGDRSGNQHHGEMHGALLYEDLRGQAESACLFDGLDDYVAISDHDDLSFTRSDFSISLWVKPLTYKASSYFICKGTGDHDREFALGLGPDSIFFFSVYDRGSPGSEFRVSGTTRVNYTDWYHVTAMRDDYMLTLYVNGEQEQSLYGNVTLVNSTADVMIGGFGSDGQDSAFHGVIDDLYIHRKILGWWEHYRLFRDGPG